MELKPGYKRSEVGVIPGDWMVKPISQVAPLQRGFDLPTRKIRPGPFPVVYSNGVKNFHSVAMVKGPGVVTGRSGTLGKVHYIDTDYWPHNTSLWVTHFNDNIPKFIYYLYKSLSFGRFASGSGVPTLNRNDAHSYHIALPSDRNEQRAIATALSDVDALLDGLARLIAKKRDLKQAAMQQLLTGQTRLPGFSGNWEMKRIDDIALPVSEKNTDGTRLPVLTCSKHFGFMDSLSFFKNQVFSHDLSTYKVIGRDEIGYPANHIEEGSIGLQNIYDIALVSPIYVVFRVTQNVSSFFLHRLLKLDSYRQRFKTATTSSIDRRGSLRWAAFSEITVKLPPTKIEQIAIATVVADMERELAVLEVRRNKSRDLKQAMMQELLTGKTRLVAVGGGHA